MSKVSDFKPKRSSTKLSTFFFLDSSLRNLLQLLFATISTCFFWFSKFCHVFWFRWDWTRSADIACKSVDMKARLGFFRQFLFALLGGAKRAKVSFCRLHLTCAQLPALGRPSPHAPAGGFRLCTVVASVLPQNLFSCCMFCFFGVPFVFHQPVK